jgi:hypothetical protein
MYVSDLALWLGWAVFYGSIGVSIGFVVLSSRSLRPCDTRNDCSTSDLATHIARTGAACRRWLGTRTFLIPRDTGELRRNA